MTFPSTMMNAACYWLFMQGSHQGEWTWCICITPSTNIMTITTNSTPYLSQHHHHPEPTSSQHQAFCNSTDALYILMVKLFPRNHHCQINKITQSFRLFWKLLSLHLFWSMPFKSWRLLWHGITFTEFCMNWYFGHYSTTAHGLWSGGILVGYFPPGGMNRHHPALTSLTPAIQPLPF